MTLFRFQYYYLFSIFYIWKTDISIRIIDLVSLQSLLLLFYAVILMMSGIHASRRRAIIDLACLQYSNIASSWFFASCCHEVQNQFEAIKLSKTLNVVCCGVHVTVHRVARNSAVNQQRTSQFSKFPTGIHSNLFSSVHNSALEHMRCSKKTKSSLAIYDGNAYVYVKQ